MRDSLAKFRETTDELQPPWLVGRLQDELVELNGDFEDEQPLLQNAIAAVRLAPRLLAADEPRRYLIMFNSPAELRGITGFMGNFADVTIDDGRIDDGRIDVSEFGRRSDLSRLVAENGATCRSYPQEFIDRYGPYNVAMGPDLDVWRFGWENITMPAHFPCVAEAASIIYSQSGHQPWPPQPRPSGPAQRHLTRSVTNSQRRRLRVAPLAFSMQPVCSRSAG